ncbi:hypothetical protein BD770DRAFT_183981 [Pilaira anomala]|nr:hypothetical protein BD770DRAFT_183981 [Pilaira anomala]
MLLSSMQLLFINDEDANQMVSQEYQGTTGGHPFFNFYSSQTRPASLPIDTWLNNSLYAYSAFSDINEEQTAYNENPHPPTEEVTWSQVAAQVVSYDNIDDSNTITSPTTQLAKYISESHFVPSLRGVPTFSLTPPKRPYTVLRIQNTPWSASTDDINKLLVQSFTLPPAEELPLNIHILMDKTSGKSLGIAFAEVIVASKDITRLQEMLRYSEQKYRLAGRRLSVTVSGYDQLRKALFPDWAGDFKDGRAIPLIGDLTTPNRSPDLFVSQKDFQAIHNICKNYKSFHNRKCPERSFEYLMSLLINIPWLQSKTVGTWQRDLMYECYKLTTETLRVHTNKPCRTIDENLLPRLVRAALLCDGFTIKQKNTILTIARIPCPDDLLGYVTEEADT